MTYQYDGSFDGLMCCVFESIARKEVPDAVCGPECFQTTLFETRQIETDLSHSSRVLVSIPKKMGAEALSFVQRAFLTCLAEKEKYILLFLRMGYQYGRKIMRMLSDDVVNTLFKAVKQLGGEAHLLTGFIRFSICENVLAAQITPKNYVLPLLAPHFRGRYPNENFLIYDKTHGDVLIYEGGKMQIMAAERFSIPDPGEEEQKYRALWRMYYDTIAVEGRENPRCRMSQMPKRYWANMTEFAVDKNALKSAADPFPSKTSLAKKSLPGEL